MLLFRFRSIPEAKISNTQRSNLDCFRLFTCYSVPAQYFVVISTGLRLVFGLIQALIMLSVGHIATHAGAS
jgi:hypothetical protein